MYALVDAVSFYASAEKVFDPSIRNRPVVVLTNNDGCICAVCPIARKLGIPKFKPYFQVKNFLEKHSVVVRSSNYELYADLSEKMMNVISRFCDNQHIYSIDEAFLSFNNYACINDWHDYGQQIRKAIWKETRLPVGVGFGSTPTLAKAANHAAKKLSGFNGVAIADTHKKDILQRMTVEQVWGIGSKLGAKLNVLGVKSAFDLAKQNPKQMRKQFSVLVERTINELNGISCLSWDDVKQAKKEIFSTRSFGQRLTDFNALRSALVFHAYIVAKKVREQQSLIKRISVFASSSPHDDDYYKNAVQVQFASPTDNTLYIASCVATAVQKIYYPGVRFYRCGVGAIELDTNIYQPDLFAKDTNNIELMQCLDAINNRYGSGTLQLGAMNTEKFHMRREFMSPRFTSQWQDIPKIHC
ncbi:Y-family DNA polymerase [Thalassotalea fonticola]|uniref:Y-family DNA polymerase n=1 Tax=Thalassotalea fonticola TaxID=3065649 RepID=A0ABZ0GSA8_9GAMM|nr:Y-family DNA polymerase [Colwelliaceae bacterium S1-1]